MEESLAFRNGKSSVTSAERVTERKYKHCVSLSTVRPVLLHLVLKARIFVRNKLLPSLIRHVKWQGTFSKCM
jgi:hypothetical protein